MSCYLGNLIEFQTFSIKNALENDREVGILFERLCVNWAQRGIAITLRPEQKRWNLSLKKNQKNLWSRFKKPENSHLRMADPAAA